ncbi:unnamed protein product [Ilex paraguariensis]|uniref:Rhamnogalacturonase A/B/Epimerase-like pectate lyase domain-containing protein n=1 Tax=Ilex paraguariensis TaxID=185542 RepID=A0ABC8R9X2_9AQUA
MEGSMKRAYNVVDFGAQPDGQTDSTSPFLRAWMAACSSVETATIYVPFGTFLIKPIIFSGPFKGRVFFRIDGTLVAPQDYRALGNSGCWILFPEVSMVSIRGGTIDARGAGFWECRKSGRNCPVGAKILMILKMIPEQELGNGGQTWRSGVLSSKSQSYAELRKSELCRAQKTRARASLKRDNKLK